MKKLTLVSLIVCVLTLTSGSAGLIFSDNFNTADNTDINQNLATRQGGSIGTQNWASSGDNNKVISSNKLDLPDGGLQDSSAYLNYDFSGAPGLLAGNEFTIEFDLTANTNYSGFFLGTTDEASGFDLFNRPVISPSTDFGMLIKSSGGSFTYINGSSTAVASVGSGEKNYAFTVQTENFNSGTAYTISLELNGSTFDLNGATAGTSASGTWDSGSTLYMGFTTRNSQTLVDNFAVTAIPEPSTGFLLLLSTGAFYLLTRKRRTSV